MLISLISLLLIIFFGSIAIGLDFFCDYQQRKRIKLNYDAFCNFYYLDKNQFEFSIDFPFPILYIPPEKGFFDNRELIVFEKWYQAWAARKFMKSRKKEEEKAARNEESARVTQKFLNTQREKLYKLYEEADQQKKKALEENKEILLGIHEEIF